LIAGVSGGAPQLQRAFTTTLHRQAVVRCQCSTTALKCINARSCHVCEAQRAEKGNIIQCCLVYLKFGNVYNTDIFLYTVSGDSVCSALGSSRESISQNQAIMTPRAEILSAQRPRLQLAKLSGITNDQLLHCIQRPCCKSHI
jgi:hypothetical protein